LRIKYGFLNTLSSYDFITESLKIYFFKQVIHEVLLLKL